MVTSKKHLCYFIFLEGDMLKYLLWLQLIKYGNIDAKGGNGIKRNPMRLLYTLHPKDYKISWHIKDYNWRDQ